ncbi:MAG: hypothetical protein H8E44_07970 [Planctomycetes bacterium]|nr:hypothetical protein [Planctomycetota bacterium]MBL7037577.1 hypothetical protein [Pirellulaceae bacterium]
MTASNSFSSIRGQVAQVTILVGAASVSALATAAEPEFLAAQAEAVAVNPEGASFAIELVDPQTQFRVGQLIPLDLVHTFGEPSEFLINDGLASGSGTARLLEVFRVSPQTGTRQQTSDKPNFYHWAGGTPREPKTDRVYRYRVYLNEWRRFDKPGKYRFYSVSARVWKPNVWPSGNNELRLTSNVLELEIIPVTGQWQDEQLRMAVEVLDRQADETKEHRALRREALRRLRYLDTEAATRELARRHPGRNEGEKYDIGMGMHESRYKAAAVDELKRRLDVPDFVVTAPFLCQLVYLAADVQVPIDYWAFRDGKGSREELDRLTKEHRASKQRLFVEFFHAAWAAAEKKEPLVRARSVFELFQFASYSNMRDEALLTPERLAHIRAAVLIVFEQLPERDQELLLTLYWRQFGGVDFLPALRRFIAVAPEREEGARFPVPLDKSFRRFLELAPEEGRALVLAELRRTRPRATVDSLTLLPDRPIPELDDSLATRLEESMDDLYESELAAALVARYGSAAIYDRVRKLYGDDGRSWLSDMRVSMLAYLVRHNHEKGGQLVERALDARGKTGRYCTVLTDVARVHMAAELERIAIERLDDENLELAGDAVRLLRKHGSAAAEQIIWQKFERWHTAWKDRVGELKVVDSGSQTDPQVRFEYELVNALIYGRSWFTDLPKLKRVRSLCLTKPNRTMVDSRLYSWREPVAIQFQEGTESEFLSTHRSFHRGNPSYDCWYVAQYTAYSLAELKKLLARFPKGTTLSFPTGMLTDAQADERLFTDLQQHVASHGLKLVKAQRPE